MNLREIVEGRPQSRVLQQKLQQHRQVAQPEAENQRLRRDAERGTKREHDFFEEMILERTLVRLSPFLHPYDGTDSGRAAD